MPTSVGGIKVGGSRRSFGLPDVGCHSGSSPECLEGRQGTSSSWPPPGCFLGLGLSLLSLPGSCFPRMVDPVERIWHSGLKFPVMSSASKMNLYFCSFKIEFHKAQVILSI